MLRVGPAAALVLLAACAGQVDTRAGAGEPLPITQRPAWVEAGPEDSVYTISERYRVALRALIEANGLEPPYELRPGRRVTLPPPNTYVVKRGDTLYGVALRHRVHLRSLAVMNGLKEPYTITPDQTIYLPSLAVDWSERAAPDANPALSGRTPDFDWPLRGAILVRFGPASGSLRHDGVKIAARAGDPVKAAADGAVAYAGSELRGYGNLVLVQHADGWVSAYAHNRDIVVRENQRVRRGEVLAFAGSTGAVETPQLHFELRRSGRPVDPLSMLR